MKFPVLILSSSIPKNKRDYFSKEQELKQAEHAVWDLPLAFIEKNGPNADLALRTGFTPEGALALCLGPIAEALNRKIDENKYFGLSAFEYQIVSDLHDLYRIIL
jgi:hypothetical protein